MKRFIIAQTEADLTSHAGLALVGLALETGHVHLDADVTPFDDSQTNKEGEPRTYKGYDVCLPIEHPWIF